MNDASGVPRSTSPRLLGLILAAAVVVLALPVIGLLAARPIGITATPSASGTMHSVESQTPMPTATSAGASQTAELPTWPVARLPQPVQSYGGAWPRAAVEGGPGHVAVGFMSPCCADVGYKDEPWMTVIWTSTDGIDWQLVPDLESFGKSGLRSIGIDAAGTMLAVGYEVLPPPTDDPLDGLLLLESRGWRSTNGIDWYPVDVPEGELNDVLAAPSGWYLAGEADGEPAIWHATDLSAWTAWTPEGRGRMEHLAVGHDGAVVAFGCVEAAGDSLCEPAAYALPPGEGQWQLVDDALGAVHDAIAWDGGFVAVGTDADATIGMAWISADGLAWTGGELDGTPWTIAAVDGGFLAGGDAPDATTGMTHAAIWQSPDGLAWLRAAVLDRVPDQADGTVRVLVASPAGISALGTGFVFGGTALAWTSVR